MTEEIIVESWTLKPCSDGISIDIRPHERFQIDLPTLRKTVLVEFQVKIASNSIAILYTNQESIKITLYQSGRMLIETRDMEKAKNIFQNLIKSLNLN